jgi:predicted ABC-type ATPase
LKSPTFTLVAGPNGSGKSSLTGGNLDFFSAYPLLDPDVLARTIQADPANLSPLAAGREVLSKVSGYLERRESFAVETTLSGRNYIHKMRRARDLGFAVRLVYVGTSDVEINLRRIEKRVIGGGHSVPERDVRRRYTRSIQNLTIAVRVADFAIIFDNSTRQGYRVIATFDDQHPTWANPIPEWLLPLKRQTQSRS